jgi:hypothetical protein
LSVLDILKESEENVILLEMEKEGIDRKIARRKKSCAKLVCKEVEKDPSISLDEALIYRQLGRDNYLSIVGQLVMSRPLVEADLNHVLLGSLERLSYAKKQQPLIDSIFDSIGSDSAKLRLALYCSGSAVFFKSNYKAGDFIKAKFPVIESGMSVSSNRLQFEGYNSDSSQASLKLSTTKGCYEGLVGIATTLLSLIELGYLVNSVDIFERTLSKYACYQLNLKDENGIFAPTLVNSGSYLKGVIYTGKGDGDIDMLVNILEYIADNFWYKGAEDSDGEGF